MDSRVIEREGERLHRREGKERKGREGTGGKWQIESESSEKCRIKSKHEMIKYR